MVSKFILAWIYFTELALLALGLTLAILGFRDNQLSLLVVGIVISVICIMMLYGSLYSHSGLAEEENSTRPSSGPPTIIIESDNPVNVVYREREWAPKITVTQEHDPLPIV